MAVVQAVELSTYIIAFAAAAKVAQKSLSDGEDPMTIMEYNFDIEITSSIDVASDTELKLSVWRLTLSESIKVNLKNSWKINIGCKIAPTVTLNQ